MTRLSIAAAIVGLLYVGEYLQGQEASITERVEVRRALIDVRVTDQGGQVIPHLRREDFIVRIDGKPAQVQRADWHGTPMQSNPSSERSGRYVVFFVQRTLDRNVARRERDVIALSKVLHLSDPLLASLQPNDRVAIVSFDQYLKVWTDFTADQSQVRRILRTETMTGRPPHLTPSTDVSLVREGLPTLGAVTYTMEDALIHIANALGALPGAKTLLLFGQGFGTPDSLKRSLVETAAFPALLDHRYRAAVDALTSARVSVVSVDVTDARRHVLEVGLEDIAEQTGGRYVRTYPFADVAMRQVVQSLDGYYTLSIERPPVQRGRRRLDIRAAGDMRVQAPRAYVE
jgi:VWFA-related protein